MDTTEEESKQPKIAENEMTPPQSSNVDSNAMDSNPSLVLPQPLEGEKSHNEPSIRLLPSTTQPIKRKILTEQQQSQLRMHSRIYEDIMKTPNENPPLVKNSSDIYKTTSLTRNANIPSGSISNNHSLTSASTSTTDKNSIRRSNSNNNVVTNFSYFCKSNDAFTPGNNGPVNSPGTSSQLNLRKKPPMPLPKPKSYELTKSYSYHDKIHTPKLLGRTKEFVVPPPPPPRPRRNTTSEEKKPSSNKVVPPEPENAINPGDEDTYLTPAFRPSQFPNVTPQQHHIRLSRQSTSSIKAKPILSPPPLPMDNPSDPDKLNDVEERPLSTQVENDRLRQSSTVMSRSSRSERVISTEIPLPVLPVRKHSNGNVKRKPNAIIRFYKSVKSIFLTSIGIRRNDNALTYVPESTSRSTPGSTSRISRNSEIISPPNSGRIISDKSSDVEQASNDSNVLPDLVRKPNTSASSNAGAGSADADLALRPETLRVTPNGIMASNRVVWLNSQIEKAKPEHGTVKWVGRIKGVLWAGVLLDNPAGNSSGLYCYGSDGQQHVRLFECKLGYGRFMKLEELMLYSEYYSNQGSGIICMICREDFLQSDENQERHDENEPETLESKKLQRKREVEEESSRNMAATQCGHLFHYGCLNKWFNTTKNMSIDCPCCGKEIIKNKILRIYPAQIS